MPKIIALVFFASLLMFMQSCGSGCGGPEGYNPTTRYNFLIADSTNKILELSYHTSSASKEVFKSDSGIQSLVWVLVISEPSTQVIIRHKTGTDTLVYSVHNAIQFTEEDECDQERISYNISEPLITNHTFSKINKQSINYSYSYSYRDIYYHLTP